MTNRTTSIAAHATVEEIRALMPLSRNSGLNEIAESLEQVQIMLVRIRDALSSHMNDNRDTTVAQVIDRVSALFYLERTEILSERRSRDIAQPRQLAIYLVRQLRPDLSCMRLGRHFNRDHTSILHALKRGADLVEKKPEYREIAQAILQEFAE